METKNKTQKTVYAVMNIVGGVLSVLGILAWILSPTFLGRYKMLVALILVVLGCAIISYASKRYQIVKKGMEANENVQNMLKGLPEAYKVFENVTIEKGQGSATLDRLIVSKYGITIIDVKNHNGNISGKLKDEMWKQDKFQMDEDKHTLSINNPVKEIRFQIKLLNSILKEKDISTRVEGYVYFPAAEKISTNVKEVTNSSNKLISFIQDKQDEVLDEDKMNKIIQLLGL